MNRWADTSGQAGSRVEHLLADPVARGVLIAASRDPDAKLTFIVTAPGGPPGSPRLAVKIPSTPKAGEAVEREGRMLVNLRRTHLGELAKTVPRYVQSLVIDGRPVLVSTAMPGIPMSVAYHQWLHTARPRLVKRDFIEARAWLGSFQSATEHGSYPVTWASDVGDAVRGRWDGHPDLDAAMVRLDHADRALRECRAPRTAVHGDFWFGNLLLADGRVTGVVDWECGTPDGSPLRDLARFALSYCLYLDRHTRSGKTVLGHPGLSREGFAPGVAYGLLGTGWLPRTVRSFLARGIGALGLPPALWYDVALIGIGEVAASANDDEFGSGHLSLLAGLPVRPRYAS